MLSYLFRCLAVTVGRGMIASAPVLICLLAGGCANQEEASNEASSAKARPKPQKSSEWLGKRDKALPHEWLATHAAAQGTNKASHSAREILPVLANASRLFGETPRMIANRAVQLETMLSANGIGESALDLVVDMSSTVAARGDAEGFGARCQQYFNLRVAQKNSREEALTILKRG